MGLRPRHPGARLAQAAGRLIFAVGFWGCGGSIALLPPDLAGHAGPLPIDHPLLGYNGTSLDGLTLREDPAPLGYQNRSTATISDADGPRWRVVCERRVEAAWAPPLTLACQLEPARAQVPPALLLLWAPLDAPFSGWFLLPEQVWRLTGSGRSRMGQLSLTMGLDVRHETRGVSDAYVALETARLELWAHLDRTQALGAALAPLALTLASWRDPRAQWTPENRPAAPPLAQPRPDPQVLAPLWLPFFQALASRGERDALRAWATLTSHP